MSIVAFDIVLRGIGESGVLLVEAASCSPRLSMCFFTTSLFFGELAAAAAATAAFMAALVDAKTSGPGSVELGAMPIGDKGALRSICVVVRSISSSWC